MGWGFHHDQKVARLAAKRWLRRGGAEALRAQDHRRLHRPFFPAIRDGYR